MSDSYLQLRKLQFEGPDTLAELEFRSGVNVVCGASDTGKSFVAESIDFMFGGSELKEIPERSRYDQISLSMSVSEHADVSLKRSTAGGDFQLFDLNDACEVEPIFLKQKHTHGKTDNVSGYLLEKIGLLGKRVLRSGAKGTTQSLSFRNLARIAIVQESEIQRSGSPFWSGQYTTKTSEISTVKLLLTGIDDSSVVPSTPNQVPDNTSAIEIFDELLSNLRHEIEELGKDQTDLESQIRTLDRSIEARKEELASAQNELGGFLDKRRELFDRKQKTTSRFDEIGDLLVRFKLLTDHYKVDLDRLTAIQEAGSMFVHVEKVACPLCGAVSGAQHLEETCDGNVDLVVTAATAEISKIRQLQIELQVTVDDLEAESKEHIESLRRIETEYQAVNSRIQNILGPNLSEVRATFSTLIEERSVAQKAIDLFSRHEQLSARKAELVAAEGTTLEGKLDVATGIPESVAHEYSTKISDILKAWNFPGKCHVYYDKNSCDFVIDGKPRSSRGKGLRAITHAASNIALLEYCQSNGFSHPGFVVLDSPLLAYFKPEDDEKFLLDGTDLKERFYNYLIQRHGTDSQVIIIENQHPPEEVEREITLTVFTGNPESGRFGLF